MSPLWVTPQQLKQIIIHAEDKVPNECCGLLIGQGHQIIEVLPVNNIAIQKQHFFYIDPTDLAKHLPRITEEGKELVGIYHSHPTGKPIPSQHDIAMITYPNTISLIISLGEKQPQYAAWKIKDGRVWSVPVHVSSTIPEPRHYPHDQSRKVIAYALFICTALAIIIMLSLSISLLPPAPPTP